MQATKSLLKFICWSSRDKMRMQCIMNIWEAFWGQTLSTLEECDNVMIKHMVSTTSMLQTWLVISGSQYALDYKSILNLNIVILKYSKFEIFK